MRFDFFIKNKCFFHDFTNYIQFIDEEFERSETIIKLFRNRRMGKSLFLDALSFYFGVGSKDQYECLFKGLKVFNYKSNFRNNMFILKFDFSGLDVETHDRFNQSLRDHINNLITYFLDFYPNLKLDKSDIIDQENAISSLERLLFQIKDAGNLLILIDEYDSSLNRFFGKSKEIV